MSKKLEQAALFAGFLALAALAAPVHAKGSANELPAVEAPTPEPSIDYCTEEERMLRREMARTDGYTNPPLQTEEECRMGNPPQKKKEDCDR